MQPDLFQEPKLKMIRVSTGGDFSDDICRCPHCSHEATLDGYDVGGAGEDCVFCLHCHREIEL